MQTNKTISIDQLGDEVANIVEQYGVVVASNLTDVIGEVAEDMKEEIPSQMTQVGIGRSNKRKHLADSWKTTDIVNTGTQRLVRIHAINGKYRIVHLLENDHLNRNGTTFRGRHFLRNLLNKYSPILERRVRETIAKGDGL